MDIEPARNGVARVAVRESMVAVRTVQATGSNRDVRDEPMHYCPSCSKRLHNWSCKLVCPSCGYYMSCSDFY